MNSLTVYQIPNKVIKLYYNLIGLYDEKENIESQTRCTNLNQLKKYRDGDLPPFSHGIDFYMQRFIEKLTSRFSSTPSGIIAREEYYESYINILGLALNLKTIDSKNPKEEYKRQNILLIEFMKELNNMPIPDVICLYQLMGQQNKEVINQYEEKFPNLIKLVLLGLINNNSLCVSNIFDNNKIDYKQIDIILKENDKNILDISKAQFRYRLTYKEVKEKEV